MSLPQDLLEQAEHLARRDHKKPRQANLRRAVSTAYYALFHLLVADASLRFAPNRPRNALRLQIGRAFNHADMREACKFFMGSNVTNPGSAANLLHLVTDPIEPEIRSVALAFISLQEARHKADYDLSASFDRLGTLTHVRTAQQAFVDWKAVRETPNANVFLASLLLWSRWRR